MRRRTLVGLSLVELLTVLAVASVLLGVAAPGMATLVRRQQLRGAVDTLYGAVRLARAQAVARNTRVLLTPLGTGNSDWRDGWVVFIDDNDNLEADAGERVIAQYGPLPRGVTVSSSFPAQHGRDYVAYNGAGRSCAASNSEAPRLGTLSLFDRGEVRRIKINMLGRARVCDPARASTSCGGDDAPP